MTDEELSKTLYDFKFHNLTLEKAITKILEGEGSSAKCLTNKDLEPLVKEFADLLLDYKWNQTNCTKAVQMQKIRKWISDNSSKLTSSSWGYGGGF